MFKKRTADPDREPVLTRLAGRFTRPSVYHFPLQTDQVAGPLQFTKTGVFAWYILGPLNWEFMTLTERVSLWDVQRSRFGQLAEGFPDSPRPFRIRRTTRPYAAFEWAARLDAASSPLKAPPGCETWNDYLAHGQRRLRSTGLDQKTTAVGVWLGPPPSPAAVEDLVTGTDHPRKESVRLIDQLLEADGFMAGGGLDGVRATSDDMGFILHRSLAMGIPTPAAVGAGPSRWGPDEFGEFTDRRAWIARPFGQTVEVVSEVDGAVVRRHVVTLTMGVMPDQTWPDRGQDAWMMAADRLGFPVEWSLNGILVPGAQVEKAAVFEADRAQAIREHYAEHGMTPPPSVGRAIAGAIQTVDEVTEGSNREGPRFLGTVRAAVYADTAEEALSRARKLSLRYKDSLHMPLHRTLDQVRALREFVPAEPRVLKGWTRRFSVGYLAAAMPNIDSNVGTPSGPYLGYTSLSRRAFLMDLHYGPEELNMSGMVTLSAGLGGGKSVLIGSAAYSAARAGEMTIVFDPSGPLAEVTRLPELAPFSREMNLTEADEGTLAPPRMIPIPKRENYRNPKTGDPDEIMYHQAVKMSRAERNGLTFDTFRMELPPYLLRERGVDSLLQAAVRSMAMHPKAQQPGVDATMHNPRWALEFLGRKTSTDRLAADVLQSLEDAAEFPLGSLMIPAHSDPIGEAGAEDKTLVVVTMPGLEPPPADVEREYWSEKERHSQPLLHLAAFYAARFIYSRDRSERKNVFLDENHLMARWGSGRAFNIRIARDSRKWNAGVISSSQDPDDHLAIGSLDSLVGGCFVGRLPTEAAARRGCRAIGISEEYFRTFLTLDSGEFVHRDQQRRVAKVKIDMDWHPSLAALKTTPGHKRPLYSGELEPAPFLDPRLFRDLGLAA